MDFILALPKSEGCGLIMVVLDRFSQYHTFILARGSVQRSKQPTYSSRRGKVLGLPLSIANDREHRFTNKFWKDLFKLGHVLFNLFLQVTLRSRKLHKDIQKKSKHKAPIIHKE